MPAKQNKPAYSYMPPTSRGRRYFNKTAKNGKVYAEFKRDPLPMLQQIIGKSRTVKHLEIKCSRCKTINHIN